MLGSKRFFHFSTAPAISLLKCTLDISHPDLAPRQVRASEIFALKSVLSRQIRAFRIVSRTLVLEMADTAAVAAPAPAPAAAASPAKKASKSAAASKKPRGKPAHPRTSEMVNGAIKALKERGGSSLQAIKKYISANYKVDAEKLSPFIKKYLKSAVTSGELVQTKGKGASGSFKLSSAKPAAAGAHHSASGGGVAKARKSTVGKVAAAKKKSVKAVTKRASTGGSPAKKKSAIKKKAAAPAAKKAPAAKAAKASVAAKPKKAAAPAAVSKVQKKVTKVPTKKPKAPKPKKAVAVKAKPSPAKKATSTSRSRK